MFFHDGRPANSYVACDVYIFGSCILWLAYQIEKRFSEKRFNVACHSQMIKNKSKSRDLYRCRLKTYFPESTYKITGLVFYDLILIVLFHPSCGFGFYFHLLGFCYNNYYLIHVGKRYFK